MLTDFLYVVKNSAVAAILIAMYEGENQVSAEVRTAVEKMAKYLEDSGY